MSEPDASETVDDPDEPDSDADAATEETPGDAEASADDTSRGAVDLGDVVGEDAPDDTEVGADLVDRVEETDPEQLATEVASLRMRVETLESELESREDEAEELKEKLKRKQADFQNYKKRMKKRREEEKERATEDLVERLLDVRDNLQRALEQDEDADIRDGIEATLRQFDEELDQENVAVVEPEPGEDVDPQRHEVLLRVESDQPEGTVAAVHRPGYEMADKVIRTAQVTVSEGPSDDEK
jgi:molecular chaperone GrpE